MRRNLHSGIVPQGISDLEWDVIVGHECRGFRCVGSESLLLIFDTPPDSHFTPELTFVGQCAPSCEALQSDREDQSVCSGSCVADHTYTSILYNER